MRSTLGMAAAWATDPEAEVQCRTALTLARQFNGLPETARAMNCLGEAAYFAQDLEGALTYHREAERLWERIGNDRGLAQTLSFQGYANSDLSRFDLARSCYERARVLWTSLGDRREQALTLVADARLRARRGEYQEALNGFDAALARLQPMGDAVWEGGVLTGIGTVHADMGEMKSALGYWQRALDVFDRAGLRLISIDVLMSLGWADLASGDDGRALVRFTRALFLARELSNTRWQALALRGVGAVYLSRQRPGEAREHLLRSLDLQQALDDPRLGGETRADLGEVHNLLGDHACAAEQLREALALSRRAEDRVTEARARFGLAKAALGGHDLAGARRHVEQALTVVESLRTAVENRDLRASYFASVHEYHDLHLGVLMRLHRVRPLQSLAIEAFEASERARARSLVESLAEASVDLRAGVDPDLLRREQASREAFDDWARRRRRLAGASAGRADLAVMAAEYRALEDRYSQIQAEVRSRSPRYAALVRPQPLALKDVQARLLDADTLLLEYALGEDRSYLWAVTNTNHAAYELAPRAEIERAATRVHALLTARLTATGDSRERAQRVQQADAEYWPEARRLSEMLLAPVAKKMTRKRVLVVADGALQYLPFASLPMPGGGATPVPLLVAHEIVSLPSASVLAVLRRETAGRTVPPRTLVVLADPVFEPDDPRVRRLAAVEGRPRRRVTGPGEAADLTSGGQPGPRDTPPAGDETSDLPRLASTRLEADAIVAADPTGTSLRKVDFAASRAAAMSAELAGYRIVHFATHGVFDNENPGLSGVALSMFDEQGRPQDGFLRLHDIYGLNLPVELVVLSACNTALGRPVRGEGLVGVVRGFMYAGARRVLASLWKVDDEATGEMMGRFYREMLQRHHSPAAALREAQLSMWQQNRWRPPYYWAAFVLQGEWQ
jgi:CHAT domain-containing protein/tetratricopeptide (TPR) repeat protein